MQRMLLTGFEPFAHHQVNPSWEAAGRMQMLFPSQVIARLLPVDHEAARTILLEQLLALRPETCLCMGLAVGDRFRLERSARKPEQFHLHAGAPSHSGNLRWHPVARALDHCDAPWTYSDDCGRYVCESTYWALLQFAAEHGWPEQCGFLHVPASSDVWPVDRTIEVVRQVIEEMLRPGSD